MEYNDSRIRVIENENNIGLTKSLNKGIDAAKGKYIARQDADDISEPDRLEKQVEYLDANPKTAVLGTGAYIISDTQVRRLQMNKHSPSYQDFLNRNEVIHGSAMIRSSVLEEFGGYNESFRYAQDYELWLRIVREYDIDNLDSFLFRKRAEHSGRVSINDMSKSVIYSILAVKCSQRGVDETKFIPFENSREILNKLSQSEQHKYYIEMCYRSIINGDTNAAKSYTYEAFHLKPFSMDSGKMLLITHAGSPLVYFGFEIRRIYDMWRYMPDISNNKT
jgi:glycosyltransferase involved in cell wall biosynthesis